MKIKTTLTFGDDRAKTNPWHEDRLGVAPLAQRLARVIYSLKAPYGYVIGVNGMWGHGKSTLLNFACAYLEKYNEEAANEDDKIIVIEFRPWMVSGHQDLVSAFFKVLSESLGPRESWIKRTWRKAVKQFGGSSDAVMDALAKVAIAVDIGVTKGVATAVVNIAKRPVKDKIDHFLRDESLQSAHSRLVEQLEKSNKRFLVTVDDIDRLSGDEVTSIMQMVKTVGQLPNVVYLLSYDRNKISEAFKEPDTETGPLYSDKIIQHEIELPRPSKNSLLRILDNEISFMTGYAEPDDLRWFTIVSDGIRRWVENPRDVLRLANAVKFSWPALEGEIDPVDLLAMEGVRLFETQVFNWIRDNRDFLFREGQFRFLDASARQPFVDRFKESLASGEDRDQILKIVSVLFPSIGDLTKQGGLYHSEPYHLIAKRRGIASEAGYDAYFSLNPSPDAISKRVIDDVVSGDSTEEQLNSTISSYIGKRSSTGKTMVTELIEELRYRFDSPTPPVVSQPIVNALFSNADGILSEPRSNDIFALSPSSALLFLLEKMLRLAGTATAARFLESAFSANSSIVLCADLYLGIGRDLSVFPADNESHRESPVVDHQAFEELGRILLGRIIQASGDGELAKAHYFWNVLRVWTHFDKSDEPKIWLHRWMMDDASFMLKVAHGLVGVSHSTKGKSYRFTDTPDLVLYDFHAICNAARKHLQGAKLADDDRHLLEVVFDGATKLRCQSEADSGEPA
ncbi:P-loop NTPase fold protein [Burkholderia sp. Bp8998]|uniref:KAP family P-loop NTPase fold protein n=1 Tax=Burkholderia sp. Bp8998 TaxID=2184557 RepID=UPI000F59959A|nr:P-loop NTPase fold protein [Burkholderia sp. Bp8998]RQS12090.1 hypothetical protein DIE06_27040 [Burkholderia sp. Bp8998]